MHARLTCGKKASLVEIIFQRVLAKVNVKSWNSAEIKILLKTNREK